MLMKYSMKVYEIYDRDGSNSIVSLDFDNLPKMEFIVVQCVLGFPWVS